MRALCFCCRVSRWSKQRRLELQVPGSQKSARPTPFNPAISCFMYNLFQQKIQKIIGNFLCTLYVEYSKLELGWERNWVTVSVYPSLIHKTGTSIGSSKMICQLSFLDSLCFQPRTIANLIQLRYENIMKYFKGKLVLFILVVLKFWNNMCNASVHCALSYHGSKVNKT
jgi:hypothetical protein